MSIEIRTAAKTDTPAIDQLLGRSYRQLLKPDYAPSVLVTIVPLISKAQPKLIASGSYFVATEGEAEGQILGAGGWTATGAFGESVEGLGHIRHFATDPKAVRKGVGRGLIETCFAEARWAGMQEMACNSTLTAEPFYAAMGFKAQRRIEVELRPGIAFPAVAMHRAL